MTLNEKTEQELTMEKRFYSWTPDTAKFTVAFRCLIHPGRIMMTEAVCQARATKPDIFSDCSGKCPRWKHYRKLVKKTNGQEPLAYPPHRRIP